MRLELDQWQREILETIKTGKNIALRSGRQVGKSTIIAIGAGEFAINNSRKTIMIIAATERQAGLLFEKVLNYLADNYRANIKTGKDRPTKTRIKLRNGSIIYCLPCGESGYGIRGYTIDMLIADEAAFIPSEVFDAVTPMLATTHGSIILLSTPFGREGFFPDCFKEGSNFSTFHISSEDCPRVDKEFLAREKQTKTKRVYAQEYLGEFVDELMQFFPDDLIHSCQKLRAEDHKGIIRPKSVYFLGVDVGHAGGDETAYTILDRKDRTKLRMADCITAVNNRITDTTREILELERKYHFKTIYIDTGGLGVGCYDYLLEHTETKRKVEAINNSSRSITPNTADKERRVRLMKEDLYNNLLNLMERGEIEIFDNPEIFHSLKSIQFEYTDDGHLKIYGRYTHITEALIRAAWCVKNKNLNPFIS